MSSTTTHQRKHIRLDAQRQRDAEISRHEISELAHELLQKRHDERHAANERINIEKRTRVDNEHAIDAYKLALEHEKEKTQLEDVRFAMIVEFDAQRDKVFGPPALAKKLEAEGLKHTALLESLQAKLAREDQEAEQVLQKAVEEYEREQKIWCGWCGRGTQRVHGMTCSCGRQLVFGVIPEVINARSQAEASTLERHNTHQQLVDHHNAEWKLRQEVLQLELYNLASRQARLDLEYDFQRQFAEHDQRQKTIKQRHAKELEALENERNSALAVVQQANERAKQELLEERLRVDGWWQHFCDESEATLRRIDEDERRALDEIDHQDIAVAVKVEGEALPVGAGVASEIVADLSQDMKAQVSLRATGADEETLATTCSTVDEVASVHGSSEMARTFTIAACGEVGPAGMPANANSHGASSDPSISLADVNRVQAVVTSDGFPHTLAHSMAFEPYHNLASAHVTPHNNGLQINLTTSCSNSEPADSVPDRSGSPDSGGSDSDFVEI